MIKIGKTDIYGWEAAIRGMRNPMNSWKKSDSGYYGNPFQSDGKVGGYHVGQNDLDLMHRLVKAGTDHRKFMRMITVTCDITAPRYWWAEYDTYKVGTVANSCSTMHKITEKEFTMDDFSHEHLFAEGDAENLLKEIVSTLNKYRDAYLGCVVSKFLTSDDCTRARKELWWQLIQLLPASYNQKRTVMLNYEVLANMYHSRKNHKLDEWHDFCAWIETLPYSELITGKSEEDEKQTLRDDDALEILLTCNHKPYVADTNPSVETTTFPDRKEGSR